MLFSATPAIRNAPVIETDYYNYSKNFGALNELLTRKTSY